MRSFAWMVLATTACGRFGFGDQPPDGGPEALPDAAPGCAETQWKVERIVDELTSLATDWSPAWGQGTKQIVFESDRPGGAGRSDLYLGRLDETSGRYSALRALDELNTAASEAAPTLSEDGLELFFNREGDIFRATRSQPTVRFGAATLFIQGAFGADLGSEDRELVYSVRSNGRASFLMRSRQKPGIADFEAPRSLDELSPPNGAGWPSLSRDGLELYYEAGEDLPTFFAQRPARDGKFSAGAPLSELGNASDPDVSPDGQQLLYISSDTTYVMLARRFCKNS